MYVVFQYIQNWEFWIKKDKTRLCNFGFRLVLYLMCIVGFIIMGIVIRIIKIVCIYYVTNIIKSTSGIRPMLRGCMHKDTNERSYIVGTYAITHWITQIGQKAKTEKKIE